jgi:acyl-CoA thioester hydrolase
LANTIARTRDGVFFYRRKISGDNSMMEKPKKSRLTVRIYYEDTDCGGVVYYANYLRYFERARTEYLREQGVDLGTWAEKGLYFVVSRVEIDYNAPARYSDLLEIETAVTARSKASITFSHTVRDQNGRRIADSVVVLVCVSGGRPRRLPDEFIAVL